MQKQATGVLLNLKFKETCRERFKQNKLLMVYAIYIQECALFVCKHRQLFLQHYNEKSRYEPYGDEEFSNKLYFFLCYYFQDSDLIESEISFIL